MYRPTMSPTFSTNCGSLENLKFSTRCGCNPKARQMRTMAVCDRPVCLAIRRVLQCVALAGIDSKVFVITRSTWRSVMVRGAPTRGSSNSPSSRNCRNRSRHLPTVGLVIRNFAATAELLRPSAQARTIRARSAIACDDLGRSAIIRNFSCSSSLISNGFFGRPLRIAEYAPIPLFMQLISNSGH